MFYNEIIANLVKKIRLLISFVQICIFLILNFTLSYAQNCSSNPDFPFKPSGIGQGINWNQFPEFSFPFKVVFGGPRYENTYKPYEMLRRGITHFSNPLNFNNIPIKNRAFILYNVVSVQPLQPWYTERNPWGNDMAAYQRYWDELIADIKNTTQNQQEFDVDLFVFDVERQIKSDAEIIALKKSNNTPNLLKSLSDQDFVLAYKKELQALYASVGSYFIKKGVLNPKKTKVSYYSDAPILNTFINIQGRTWEKWQSDKSAINFLNLDFSNNKVGGSFYQQQEFLTPSAYFYYDYPHPFAGEYLSYLMFQIEANRALSSKDQIVYIWQRYSYNSDFIGRLIKPWMAEAMTIFPFFAGAKGIWLWEDPGTINQNSDFSNYEYNILGMYRLSKFADMFSGDYELVEKISARDYNENKQPIWRGVKKGNSILIAAHNPWAKSASDEVEVVCQYKKWSKKIILKGYETLLCKYDLDDSTIETDFSNFQVFPNPSADFVQIKAEIIADSQAEVNVYDMAGRILKNEILQVKKGQLNKSINVKELNCNIILVELKTPNQRIAEKIIRN
jgi:Secretion system C-terminal sorting domain